MFAGSCRRFGLRSLCLGILVSACAGPVETAEAEEPVTLGTTTAALSTSPATTFFVTKLYSDLLHRSPSSSDLTAFVGLPRTTVAATVQGSAEYRSARVRGMYESYLGRSASAGEVSALVGLMSSGGSFEDVARTILVSPEYYAHAGGTDTAFLDRLYADLLGRSPGSGDLAAFLGKPRTLVVPAVQGSAEGRSRVVQGIYSALLRRAASSSEISMWLASWPNELGVRSAVVSSDEYASPARFVIRL
jgi:hypothetical protein